MKRRGINSEFIIIEGASQNNLKNISLKIPKNLISVFTGVSGSGKSSLAFDTIFAEGQRRYLESFSTYARQFLQNFERPKFEKITGLAPTIGIGQKFIYKNPRSTVGTLTEIYDYLKLLFSKCGVQRCFVCGKEVKQYDANTIVKEVLKNPPGSRLFIFSPYLHFKGCDYTELFKEIQREGFVRARIDGQIVELHPNIRLNHKEKHRIDIVIDRILLKDGIEERLIDSIETGLHFGRGKIIVMSENRDCFYSEEPYCSLCNINYLSLSPQIFSFNSPAGMCPSCNGLGFLSNFEFERECYFCNGTRLRKEALSVYFAGVSMGEILRMPVQKLLSIFNDFSYQGNLKTIADELIKKITNGLKFLTKLGLGDIFLSRAASSLSAGEFQRCKIVSQLGSEISGVIYILDEPTVGLHPRDIKNFIEILKYLKDLKNTVIIVDHDKEIISNADYIVDFGPAGGKDGGKIVFSGTPSSFKRCKKSLTEKYLKGELSIPVPQKRRKVTDWIKIKGASENNLKNIDVDIPLNVFCVVSGVGGAGKRTLIMKILYPYLINLLSDSKKRLENVKSIQGGSQIKEVINIDQEPIGGNLRSNPATYTGIFDDIRILFSKTKQARLYGYLPSRFSFNLKGGRCEKCEGAGILKVEMQFLNDIYVQCDECNGKRFNPHTLRVRYRGYNISQILDLTVSEAIEIFDNVWKIKRILKIMEDIGIGYIKLGQPSTSLSGGEAQRIKISKEVSKKEGRGTLYIFVEPSRGLHFDDINKLLNIINKLIDMGNSLLMIENNLDIIKNADYIIDLGPEGGEDGGMVVAVGTPEEIMENQNSLTGKYLKKYLRRN